MSVKENKHIAHRWHEEVFNKRNIAAIDELLDVNYINHSANIRGLADAKKQFTQLLNDNPDLKLITEETVAEGDKVVTHWTWYDGEKEIVNGISMLRIAGGKIVEDWFWTREPGEA